MSSGGLSAALGTASSPGHATDHNPSIPWQLRPDPRSLPTSPLNPHLQPGVWLPGRAAGPGLRRAPVGPGRPQTEGRPEARARRVPPGALSAAQTCLPGFFHTKHASQGSNRSDGPRVPTPPSTPPQRRTAARGRPGRTCGARDGAPDPSACGTGLWDEPRGGPRPDHQHGRSPP